MSSFKENCQKFFGTTNLYEILGITTEATEKEIKKAYHKLSLCVHPDRVDESEKIEATEKFKVLGKVHSILQDKEKRRCYDDFGEIDDETDSTFNWEEYWRAIFRPIKLSDIEKHKQEYIGSDTELRDIKKAYEGTKGNMDQMLERIPFSDCDSEDRIQEIVRKMIDDGEVEEYPGFFNEPERKKKRRRNKWEEEKKESESVDLSALEKEIAEANQKRIKGFSDMIAKFETEHTSKKRKSITNGPKKAPTKKRTGLRSNK